MTPTSAYLAEGVELWPRSCAKVSIDCGRAAGIGRVAGPRTTLLDIDGHALDNVEAFDAALGHRSAFVLTLEREEDEIRLRYRVE